ncbi:hypothetical protein X895_2080 [Burkholderia pseudomallei MSHR4503]|nr:hypothetical protein X895_2080 [Burkholderia pseudomallei MSHR4503]
MSNSRIVGLFMMHCLEGDCRSGVIARGKAHVLLSMVLRQADAPQQQW